MTGSSSFTDILRALDDAKLEPSATRLLLHYWRVGVCWETRRTTAEKTGMSVGSVHKWHIWLEKNGYIELAQKGDRMGFRLRIEALIPVENGRSEYEQTQQADVVLVHNLGVDVQNMNANVQNLGTLPLSIQKEEYLPKVITAREESAAVNGEGEGWKQEAWEAIRELILFWEQLTKRKAPPQKSEAFLENWFKPFNQVWIICGNDVDAAKAKIQAVRNDMLAQGFTLFDPAKLPGHVQTMVDRELLPMTARLNGNGNMNFKDNPAAREAYNRAVLEQVAQEIKSGEWSPWTI